MRETYAIMYVCVVDIGIGSMYIRPQQAEIVIGVFLYSFAEATKSVNLWLKLG